MTHRRDAIGALAAGTSVLLAGCLGGGSDDGGDETGGDMGASDLSGEVRFDGDTDEFLSIEHAGQFQDGEVSQDLVVSGEMDNGSDSSLNVELVLDVDGYIPNERTTLTIEPQGGTEFSIEYNDVDPSQIAGYTLEVGFSSPPE